VAAKDARLEHIVGLTQWTASPSHPSLMTRQHWLVDRLFSMTPGVTHTIVRPGFFADDYLVTIGFAPNPGIFPLMFVNSRNAPPSNEDIARVAVAALMDPERHAGKSYRPTGPQLLGVEDMAKAIGRAVGRSVKVVPTPPWLFMKAARMSGYPIDVFSGVRYYIDDHKRGAFELGAPTTDVLDVTGRPPEDFETIARRYAVLPPQSANPRQLAPRVCAVHARPAQPWVRSGPLRPRTAASVPLGAPVHDRLGGLAARARHRRHRQVRCAADASPSDQCANDGDVLMTPQIPGYLLLFELIVGAHPRREPSEFSSR